MIRQILLLLLAAAGGWWSVETSGVDSNLRGLAVVISPGMKSKIIWATGSNGAVLHSADSGKTWERLSIPGAEASDLRGVQAFGATTAYVMASGEGEKSGIFKTSDRGKTWTKQYSDPRKDFFLDAITCTSESECFALADPIAGRFVLIHTVDGNHWKEMTPHSMPRALPQEGAFAASNSCLLIDGGKRIYFATGGPAARVFHSTDQGATWTVADTPIASGKAAAGAFSLSERGDLLIAVGGDYQLPDRVEKVAAYSGDSGESWKLAAAAPRGYRSGVAASGSQFFAVGPSGAEKSSDGKAWEPAGSLPLNVVVSAGGEIWGAGPKGTVARWAEE